MILFMDNMNTTDRAAQLRQALKARYGWTSRDVSIRADYYSMGSAIRIKIKNADVDLAAVKSMAESHENISRCEITGEILNGGNRYVTVGYSSEASDVLRARKLDVVTAAAAELATANDNSLVDIAGTPYMLGRGRHGYGFAIWKHASDGTGGHQSETQDVNDAALYVAIGGWNQ